MQAIIGHNLENLEAAMSDQKYVSFCQKKYKKLAKEIENAKEKAILRPDIELANHYNNLDKYFTRTTEWKLSPLENPEHDFVSDLLNAYMEDIERRVEATVGPHA